MGAALAGLCACGDSDAVGDGSRRDASTAGDAASIDGFRDSGMDAAGASPDAGDAASADAGDGAAPHVSVVTLASYLSCESDLDCPVGFGDCVTEVPFNVPDATGEDHVAITELLPDLDSAGVCTRVCTNGADACQGLSLEDARGDTVEYTCQLVVVGESPYPGAALPFTVDAEDMAAGVAFGALCRPPFQLHPDVLSRMCDPCSRSADCGDGVCYDSARGDEGSSDSPGECLMSCDADADCPAGFACEALEDAGGSSLGDHCRPLADTCGACLDADGDGRGVGHCGDGGSLTTPVDCDDGDPEV